MRFMIIPQPDPNAPKPATKAPPSDAVVAAYMKYNEDLYNAGVLVTSEGVNPEGPRARLATVKGKRKVVDGPFTESKELVGGFYMIEVKSKEEAIEWALKCPTGLGGDEYLAILPMTALADLPSSMLEVIEKAAPNWFASVTAEEKKSAK